MSDCRLIFEKLKKKYDAINFRDENYSLIYESLEQIYSFKAWKVSIETVVRSEVISLNGKILKFRGNENLLFLIASLHWRQAIFFYE